jgi:hypothetical protein
MSFTFIATNQLMMPTLQPHLIMVEKERFDPNLNQRRGAQIGRQIRVATNGVVTTILGAWEIKPDAGLYGLAGNNRQYDADCVIVGLLQPNTVFMNTGEYYVFKREDWEKVRKIAEEREPADTVPLGE